MEYGHGDSGRLRFQAPTEQKALKAFLERRVASGKTFRESLEDREREEIKLCVKDPTVEGTREDPNYPSVVTYTLEKQWVESR
ncbi:MAG: hypothetical protein ABEJ62_02990 [Candidatus Nanohaloarchaea archaeon]